MVLTEKTINILRNVLGSQIEHDIDDYENCANTELDIYTKCILEDKRAYDELSSYADYHNINFVYGIAQKDLEFISGIEENNK